MWISDCIIVVDQNNVDHNTIAEIAAAVQEVGGAITVHEDQHTIEASIPASEVATVAAMTGVSYIRCVFSYYVGDPTLTAA